MGNTVIFGGTFNPIHNEHVKMIRHLSTLDFVHKILVIPTHIPPHKTVGYLADDSDRINMCEIATQGIPKVLVSDFEIKRKGKSYTFYTVSALKKEFPNDNFFVVCGGDMAITLDTWYNYRELKKICTFLVIDRPDTNPDKLKEYLENLKSDGAKIIYTVCPTKDVSSTKLREALSKGEEKISDIPVNVAEYIRDKKLYGCE